MVERGKDILEVDRTLGGRSRQAVGVTDYLAGLASASDNECRADPRPVVPAAVLVDLWRSSELAPGDDRDVIEHASLVEVVHQRGQALVDDRGHLPHSREVLGVRVEVADRQADHADSGFDQPAGQQKLQRTLGTLAGHESFDLVRRSLVPCDHLGRLVAEIQRFGEAAGSENADGLLGEAVHRFHHATGIDVPLDTVQSGQQLPPRADTPQREIGVQREAGGVVVSEPGQLALHARFQFAGENLREIGAEGAVGGSQESRTSAVADERTTLHQVHERRCRVLGRTQQLVDHAAHRRTAAQ